MQWSGGAPYVNTYMETPKDKEQKRVEVVKRIGITEFVPADASCKCCKWLQRVKSDPIGTRGGNGAWSF